MKFSDFSVYSVVQLSALSDPRALLQPHKGSPQQPLITLVTSLLWLHVPCILYKQDEVTHGLLFLPSP